MAKYYVFDYNDQIIGEVDAVDAVEAWSKAGKDFDNILDIRLQMGQIAMVGVTDGGDTKWNLGDVISEKMFVEENERVKLLGLRPAFGEHFFEQA